MNSQTTRWARRAASLLFSLLLVACGGGGGNDTGNEGDFAGGGNGSGSNGGSVGGGSSSGSTPRTADLVRCPDNPLQAVQGTVVTVTCQPVNGTSDLTFGWQLLSPAGETIPAGNGLSLTFTPQQVTTYQLRLTASNGVAGEAEKVTVHVSANPAPTVDCPARRIVVEDNSVRISCAVQAGDGDTLTYDWAVTPPPGVSAPSLNESDADVTFTPTEAGVYTATLTVSDGFNRVKEPVQVQVDAPTYRIVMIGDSITQGGHGFKSYRYELWKKLIDAGLSFDFIGSQHQAKDDDPPLAAYADYQGHVFDTDHEGYWGRRADQVANKSFDFSATADIALIHLGTNDGIQYTDRSVPDPDDPSQTKIFPGDKSETAQSTATDVARLIDRLRAHNPSVTILLAKIIPTRPTMIDSEWWDGYRAELDSLAAAKNTAASPVVIVDQADGFDANADLQGDGVHPNERGEARMAKVWCLAIKGVVGSDWINQGYNCE